MKFSFSKTHIGVYDKPDLIISVSEFTKGVPKKGSSDIKELEEFNSLQLCIQVYTFYCGHSYSIHRDDYIRTCETLDKNGTIIISCLKDGYNADFLARQINDAGERPVPFLLFEPVPTYKTGIANVNEIEGE